MTIIKIVSRMIKHKKRSVCLERKSGEVYIIVQEEDKKRPLVAPNRSAAGIKEDEVRDVLAGLINILEIKDLTISEFKNYEEFQEVFKLTDRYVMLRRLLEEVPETDNPDEFDEVLETRRKVYCEMRKIVDDIGKKMEDEWANKLWEKVKHKKLKEEIVNKNTLKVPRDTTKDDILVIDDSKNEKKDKDITPKYGNDRMKEISGY